VIIDCDPGHDDMLALVLAAAHPGIDLLAITTVAGNGTLERTTANARATCELAGITGVPLAAGAPRPLVAPPRIAANVHGESALEGATLPTGDAIPLEPVHAVELMARTIARHPTPVTLVPTGPLTNVAAAVVADPEIARLYKRVVLMGGAFLAKGNAARWAEANIWHDPEAAQVVFEAGWDVTAVGLDVTDKTMLSQARLDVLRDSGTVAGVHIHRITKFYVDRYSARTGRRECAMHDALALAIAADPSLMLEAPKVRVDVELNGTHTRGMTVGDFRSWVEHDDANATVPLAVDSERFITTWMETLSRP
jgi:inosine-uridine nucleoside N-ribohydrolase